jgi:hypothetical protein
MSSKHLLILLLILCIHGCSNLPRMEQDWKLTSMSNLESAYSEFLFLYPDSPYRDEAKRRIDALDFAAAERGGTAEVYEAFIRKHPLSEQASVARERIKEIEGLKTRDEFVKASLLNTVAAYQKLIDAYPNSPESNEARKRIDPTAVRDCALNNFIIRTAIWTDEEQQKFAGLALRGSNFEVQTDRLVPAKGAVFVMLVTGIEGCSFAYGTLRVEAKEREKVIEPDGTEDIGMYSTLGVRNNEVQIQWKPPTSEPLVVDFERASSVMLFPVKKSALESLKVRFLGRLYDLGRIDRARPGEIRNLYLTTMGTKANR